MTIRIAVRHRAAIAAGVAAEVLARSSSSPLNG